MLFLAIRISGENWQDIQKTIALIRDTRPDDIGVSVSYPLPGTKFFDRVRAQIGKKTNWADSEDLSMMFRGAYTDEFYRALHDALHMQVDAWHSGSKERNSDPAGSRILRPQRRSNVGARNSLEKTCRNSDPTMLEALSTDSLVQLQPAPSFAHGCSSINRATTNQVPACIYCSLTGIFCTRIQRSFRS